jgi:hypothetical protein
MKRNFAVTAVMLALALAASGCVYMPKENIRLEEARGAQARILADRDIVALAPAEVRRAEEAFERAVAASDSLQDPALVDHLAYVARQRAAIAAEVAQRIAAERAAVSFLRPVSASR